MPETAIEKLVTRSGKVAFMQCADEEMFTRMTKFTSMSKSANPKEYTRSYVDEDGEVSDVTGYAPSIAYGFDWHRGNKVHEDLINITEEEKVGDDAVRKILIVDMGSSETGKYTAKLRSFSVIADADGDGTEAYTYSGTFKAKGKQETVSVTLSENDTIATISE